MKVGKVGSGCGGAGGEADMVGRGLGGETVLGRGEGDGEDGLEAKPHSWGLRGVHSLMLGGGGDPSEAKGSGWGRSPKRPGKKGPISCGPAGRPRSAPDRQAPVKVFLSLPRLLAALQHLRLTSPEDCEEVVLPGAVVPRAGSPSPSPMALCLPALRHRWAGQVRAAGRWAWPWRTARL